MDFRMYINACWRNEDRFLFYQPNVPVNSRAFVKPSFCESCIYAHGQHVLIAVIHKVGEIKTKWSVAAEFFSNIMSVEHHHGMTEHTVEFHRNAFAFVRRRNIEHAAIPSDARFRKIPADWFCAVIGKIGVAGWLTVSVEDRSTFFKWKFNGPVMWQVKGSPLTVVKTRARDRRKSTGLSECGLPILRAEPKILCGIVRVAEMEAPARSEERRVG